MVRGYTEHSCNKSGRVCGKACRFWAKLINVFVNGNIRVGLASTMLHAINIFLIYDARSLCLTLEGKEAEDSGAPLQEVGGSSHTLPGRCSDSRLPPPLGEPRRIKGKGASATQHQLLLSWASAPEHQLGVWPDPSSDLDRLLCRVHLVPGCPISILCFFFLHKKMVWEWMRAMVREGPCPRGESDITQLCCPFFLLSEKFQFQPRYYIVLPKDKTKVLGNYPK